jgi:4-amino-4-deoxy-L-arabinose transferase-like glycosyltransferase
MNPIKQASLPPTACATESPQFGFLPTRNQFFGILLAYFTLLLVSRVLISEVAGIDEADQVVVGQKLSWGYGPQPPLYTWLVMGCLRLFGYSIFSLTLLREILLFSIYVITYCNTHTLTRSHACGLAAAVALQLHPSISWESQRELTHSILASAMLLAMLLAFFRLQPGRWGAYLAFGGFAALATLSKYNAALFCLSLLLAAFSIPGFRAQLFHWRMAAALGLSLLILSPHLLWILHHRDLAFASVYKFHIREALPWWSTVRLGLKDWISTAAAHLSALLVIFGALFWQPIFRRRSFDRRTGGAQLLWRTFLILVALVVFSVLLFRVTSFKDRWLQPIFVSLPILLIVGLRESLSPSRLKAMVLLAAVISVVVAVLAPGRLLLTERLNKREILNAPFRQLAPDLDRFVRSTDFVVSDDRWMAANVHLWFPDKLTLSPDLVSFFGASGRRCLLVWEASRRADLPPELSRFALEFTGKTSLPATVWLEETWKYHHSKKMRVGVMLLER